MQRDGFSSEHPDTGSPVEPHISRLQQRGHGKPLDRNPEAPKEPCEVSRGCLQVSTRHGFSAKNVKGV